MTTLTSLPSKVINKILSYNDISFEDIINFRCVCKKFRWAAKTEEYCFPKIKFFQRWSAAKKYYDEQSKQNEQKQSEENKQKNMIPMNFIETGIDYAKQLRNYVSKKMSVLISNSTENVFLRERNSEEQLQNCAHKQMSTLKCTRLRKIFCRTNLKEQLNDRDFFKLMFENKNYIKILFFMDEIKHLLDQPIRVGCDLTKEYYYIILFDYLSGLWRKVIFKIYSEEPWKELLEESATIWAQQLQLGKNISYSSVKASLKSIALDALNFLRAKHPEHSIFSTPDEYFSHWENNNIDDNYWSETEGTQIMDTLEEYMFGELNFRLICSTDLEYACIDYVLKNKHGNDIILYIIYESVARRLGLRCDLVQTLYRSPNINLLWIPRYTFAANYRKDICLLDKEHRKNMRCFMINPYLNPNKFKDCMYGPRAIYKTTAELLKSNMTLGDSWDRSFTHTNIISHFHASMEFVSRRDVKFAVGMIVTHGESSDCSTGVIIGWHQKDKNLFHNINNISVLIMQSKMCSFSVTEQQTHYIILTKSDKLCCVKEDDIALTKPDWIKNRNIYHYFSKFEGTHYVPNEELAKVYPYDAAIATGTIFKGNFLQKSIMMRKSKENEKKMSAE